MAETLTIKSGKKGPQIKKGIKDAIIIFSKIKFENLNLVIKNFKLKIFVLLSLNLYNFIVLFINCRRRF